MLHESDRQEAIIIINEYKSPSINCDRKHPSSGDNRGTITGSDCLLHSLIDDASFYILNVQIDTRIIGI